MLVLVNVKEIQVKELYKMVFYYKMDMLLAETNQGKILECETN